LAAAVLGHDGIDPVAFEQRALGIDVIMVRRPSVPDVPSADTVDQLAAKVDHLFEPVAERGV
ncbi:MAG: hypothetical protein EOS32_31250, partial [Mesorhizobium sp.]